MRLPLTDTERGLAEIALSIFQAADKLNQDQLIKRLAPIWKTYNLPGDTRVRWEVDSSGVLQGMIDDPPSLPAAAPSDDAPPQESGPVLKLQD